MHTQREHKNSKSETVIYKEKTSKGARQAHAFNRSHLGGRWFPVLEASMIYRVSPRIVGDTQRNPVFKRISKNIF